MHSKTSSMLKKLAKDRYVPSNLYLCWWEEVLIFIEFENSNFYYPPDTLQEYTHVVYPEVI